MSALEKVKTSGIGSTAKSLLKPLPPSVRGIKPKPISAGKPVSWAVDPKQMAAFAGKTASMKYAAMRDELIQIKLAAMPKHVIEGWKRTATQLASKEKKKVPKSISMQSLGGGGGLISGAGKAALR